MSFPHTRVDYNVFSKLAASAQAALLALGKAVDEAGLDKGLTELVKVRASQINGCAFCLQMHLDISRKLSLDPVKLGLVATWKDAGIFSEKEKAALAWTEALTDLTSHGAPDELYEFVCQHFSETELVFLTVTIGTINAWNRLGVGLRFAPQIAQQGK